MFFHIVICFSIFDNFTGVSVVVGASTSNMCDHNKELFVALRVASTRSKSWTPKWFSWDRPVVFDLVSFEDDAKSKGCESPESETSHVS